MDSPEFFIFPQECSPHIQEKLRILKEKGWVGISSAELAVKSQSDESDIPIGLIPIFSSDEGVLSAIEESINAYPDVEWVGWLRSGSSSLEDNAVLETFILRNLFVFHEQHDSTEDIIVSLVRCKTMSMLRKSNSGRSPREGMKHGSMLQMLGNTASMQGLFCNIKKVAAVDAPVFINGESGTGKELTARSIHEISLRRNGPFNAVNCGALPTHLIQSELFGHEKGAFTGAVKRKIGRIEATQGGTLFLDEIGDLPLEMQVNLLRFLEDHKIQRIGDTAEISVDVRVLAATHVDLNKAIEEGKFREDLYHRLNVLHISVPPLRERSQDIGLISDHFFDKFSGEASTRARGFSQDSRAVMQQYQWPGNVRELINRVRRATVMCEHRLIAPEDLGLERRSHDWREPLTLEKAREMAEHEVINAALVRNKYKVQKAAKELGVSRVTLYRLMEKHHLSRHASEGSHPKKTTFEPSSIIKLSSL
ncbi:DNA-binding NtrC family response regulator [Onishia taeanensis]|uniref:DNA-binding NtrC family response regulator n=1 Tax=Onishia taeanensis TaxID=284577 RepID=A0A328XRB2_9GAMM|nr:sigma-54 dependent transcriptional regulator [Halomonas taeanensis]RAR59551.1 DNA-binding NtrC family response regulator [Halomonas taeanensis]